MIFFCAGGGGGPCTACFCGACDTSTLVVFKADCSGMKELESQDWTVILLIRNSPALSRTEEAIEDAISGKKKKQPNTICHDLQ